jgi:hypothetical protein
MTGSRAQRTGESRATAGLRRRGSARSRGSTSFVDPGDSEQVPALIGLLLTVEGPFAWGKQPATSHALDSKKTLWMYTTTYKCCSDTVDPRGPKGK